MKAAPLPGNEAQRLSALQRTRLLDSMPEQAYDDITRLASFICDTPITLVSLVDADRQWFKSRVGLDAEETPRDIAFCSHAILQPDVFVVSDTLKDERFHDNPLVTSAPSIRFYAGAPLITSGGFSLGTLCVIDRRPRELEQSQIEALSTLSRQVISQVELSMSVERITDLKESLEHANQGLKRSNGELEHFAHIAAHDLKSPLRTVGSLLEIISRKYVESLDSEATGYFQRAIHANHRMTDLVDHLLEFSRLQENSGKAEVTDATMSLDDALANLDAVIVENKAEIHFDKLPKLKVSNVQLTRIFQNLINNAIKYTKQNNRPVVKISSAKQGNMVEIQVSDNGIGLDPEKAKQLFQLYQRANAEGAIDSAGSGIGLFACRKIVESYGGKIWMNTVPGQGSDVHFTLPAS